jgi:hypothetical protein
MAFIVPDVGEVLNLETLLANLLEGALMHLYGNVVAIGPGTVLGDFEEMAFAGYDVVTLTGWGPVAIDGASQATSAAPKAIFTPTAVAGTGDVYGYYLTDAGGGDLIGAEAFLDAPVNVAQFANLEVNFTYTAKSAA